VWALCLQLTTHTTQKGQEMEGLMNWGKQELLDTIKDLVFCLEKGSDGFSLGDYQTLEKNVLSNANKILAENNNSE